tara:strand:+ start:2515 stop:3615 length:1101 start_codon:yes stop_codon:yes gene_type:complete
VIFFSTDLIAQGAQKNEYDSGINQEKWFTNNLNGCQSTGMKDSVNLFKYDAVNWGKQKKLTFNNNYEPENYVFPLAPIDYIKARSLLYDTFKSTGTDAGRLQLFALFDQCNNTSESVKDMVSLWDDVLAISAESLIDRYGVAQVSEYLPMSLEIIGFDEKQRFDLLKSTVGYMENNLATTPYFRDYLSNVYVELGEAYDSGQLAIQSESIAYDYYQKAAKMGNTRMYSLLGDAFMRGSGVDKNIQKAYDYFYEDIKELDRGSEVLSMYRMSELLNEARDKTEALKWVLMARQVCYSLESNPKIARKCDPSEIDKQTALYKSKMNKRNIKKAEQEAVKCLDKGLNNCGPKELPGRFGKFLNRVNPLD